MKTKNNSIQTQDNLPLFLQLFFKDYFKVKVNFELQEFEKLRESIETLVGTASAYGFRRLNILCGELLEGCNDLLDWNSLKPAMIRLDSYFYSLETNYKQTTAYKVC
ncbi:MAG: hypothetical protein CME64_17230 [Halobacteriovoraceae bacterium]|nr:hypothetical protein [Halobacteriovoraceae bacterium]|tara:strand:+ start:269002 stop:269322 length:321 start_codon:yes stop_codon:yes gene_type:complete